MIVWPRASCCSARAWPWRSGITVWIGMAGSASSPSSTEGRPMGKMPLTLFLILAGVLTALWLQRQAGAGPWPPQIVKGGRS